MSQITVWKNNEMEVEVRTVTDEQGDVWFVAKDVCDVLGLGNSRQAVSALDDDEKNTVIFSDGIPGNPNHTTINESGLYSLVLRSNKPEAKRFKKWITSEVLPQIRKTGGYIPVNQDDDEMTILAKAVLISQRTIEIKNILIANQQAVLLQQQPKVEAFDAFIDTDGTYSYTDAFKLLGMAPRKSIQLLRDNGIITQKNLPAQKYLEKGFFVATSYTTPTNFNGAQGRVTPKGVDFLRNFFAKMEN